MAAAEEEIKEATRLSLAAAREFVIHSLIGTFLFGIIAAVAVGIHFGVDWLCNADVPPYITSGLTLAEYALFAADLFLFAVFLIRSMARTMKCL